MNESFTYGDITRLVRFPYDPAIVYVPGMAVIRTLRDRIDTTSSYVGRSRITMIRYNVYAATVLRVYTSFDSIRHVRVCRVRRRTADAMPLRRELCADDPLQADC